MKTGKTRELVLCALFVALIAVGAFIKVPIPVVPFTLQLLFTMMAGLLLGKSYQPSDPRIPDSDSLLSDGKTRLPFVAAMDMDLKRIDRAYQAAREAGYPRLALGALEPQAKALQLLYQVTGKAVVYSVAIPDLLKSLWESGQQELANTLRLYEPPPTAYITQEGGALHASAVPSHRKAGEPYRPEIWPVDGPEG